LFLLERKKLISESVTNYSKLFSFIRYFFLKRKFQEVTTNYIQPYCTPDDNTENLVVTYHNLKNEEKKAYLHTSPEFPMKKILAYTSLKKIFQICKAFRDKEDGPLHKIEFHMLEWYEVGYDYKRGIDLTIKLLKQVFKHFEKKINTVEKWSVSKIFKYVANLDVLKLNQDEFFYYLVDKIEPFLKEKELVILYKYPKYVSLSSKVKGNFSERFEVYYKGIELANGYTENTDYNRQVEIFEKKPCSFDSEFLEILKNNMLPECYGVALGLDRLLMILLDKKSIKELVLP